jgi:hypothetical protein
MLVAHFADGRIETVMYQFLPPMLLNEYQKQQRTIEAQAAEMGEQATRIAELERQTKRIAELERDHMTLEKQAAQISVLTQQVAEMAQFQERAPHQRPPGCLRCRAERSPC